MSWASKNCASATLWSAIATRIFSSMPDAPLATTCLRLIDQVRERVKDNFRVDLENEVILWKN